MHHALVRLQLFGLLAGLLQACAGSAAQTKAAASGSADPLDHASPRELFVLGSQLARSGDPIRAEQYLTAAIERGHPEEQALPILLELCLRSARLHSALSYGLPYLELHPMDVELRYLLAAVRLGLSQTEVAHRELTRVLAQAPQHARARYLRAAIARDHFRDPVSAREDFAAYLKASPQGPHAGEARAFLHDGKSKRRPRHRHAAEASQAATGGGES